MMNILPGRDADIRSTFYKTNRVIVHLSPLLCKSLIPVAPFNVMTLSPRSALLSLTRKPLSCVAEI